MVYQYEFDEKLKASEGIAEKAEVESILLKNIAGSLAVNKSNVKNDLCGTDWWVECCNGRHLSIDAKIREQDWKLKGHDDLALETWSVIEHKKIGWTLDETKRSDFILWLWKDTGRWCILPFPMLCNLFRENVVDWKCRFKVARQHTPNFGGYHSECVFVPRKELWRAMYMKYSGVNGLVLESNGNKTA